METKSLFQSKTFWVASLTFAAGALSLANSSFAGFMTPSMVGGILMVLGVLNTLLRILTVKPIE